MNTVKKAVYNGSKRFVVLTLLAGVTLCFSDSSSAATTTPAPQQAKVTSYLCHAPASDISVDSKVIVSVSNENQVLSIMLNLDAKNQKQIKLPKKPVDVVLIDNASKAIVSYGHWGELGIVDLNQGTIGELFQPVGWAGSLCATSTGKVLAMDSDSMTVNVIDIVSKTKTSNYKFRAKVKELRWIEKNYLIEAVDNNGRSLGSFKIPK